MSSVVGVDLGSYTIKAVHLNGRVNSVKLDLVGSTYNPVGQFLPNDEMQFNQLAGAIHQLAIDCKFLGKPVSTALPESLAYTSIVSMPFLSDAELASSIHWEAEQHIPVPLEEVQLEYQILHKPKKGSVGEKMQVLLVASKKTVVERVITLFRSAGLELVQLETGLLACFRSLLPSIPDNQGVAIINMGALSTDVLIVENGKMVLSYTIQTGGLMFTRAIQQGLNLTPQQAEEYKRTYGFDQEQLEGKVKQVLEPVVNILVNEIRKAIQYYQTSHMGAGIRSMVLVGGNSYLKNIAPYLTQVFTTEVMVGNPFQKIEADQQVQLPKDVATFAVATGLALSSMND